MLTKSRGPVEFLRLRKVLPRPSPYRSPSRLAFASLSHLLRDFIFPPMCRMVCTPFPYLFRSMV
jgi:hypothetical protein